MTIDKEKCISAEELSTHSTEFSTFCIFIGETMLENFSQTRILRVKRCLKT